MRIKLPYGATPPLQANHRYSHWSQKATLTKQVRHDVAWLVRSAGIKPSETVTVGLEWVPAVKRRRDGAENLGPLLKACVDGVVDSGVVDSDEQGRVIRTMPVILPVDRDNPGVWLIVDTRCLKPMEPWGDLVGVNCTEPSVHDGPCRNRAAEEAG